MMLWYLFYWIAASLGIGIAAGLLMFFGERLKAMFVERRVRRRIEAAQRKGEERWWWGHEQEDVAAEMHRLGIDFNELCRRADAVTKKESLGSRASLNRLRSLIDQYTEQALAERGLLRPAENDQRVELMRAVSSGQETSAEQLLRSSIDE